MCFALDKFVGDEIGFFAVVHATQGGWEEEYFEYQEHDGELDENNRPQRPTDGHAAETFVVEERYFA